MTNLFERQTAIRQFAVKYGLFGLMTALPTTPDYVIKHGIESMWNIENDRVMMALAMTMTDKPTIIWDFHSLLLGVQMMFSFMRPTAKIRSVFAGTARKPLSQAGRVLCFAAHSVR